MPTATANGVRLFYELTGDAGPPLVLVHGAWGDHTAWDAVVPALAHRFRVLTYDRRGHGHSEPSPHQGSAEEDAADLASLIEQRGLAPAHVAGSSFGAIIALRHTLRRPDLVRSVAAQEPPLVALFIDDPEHGPAMRAVLARIGSVAALLGAGDLEEGARQFVETVAFGPGVWAQLSPADRQRLVDHAPTFLDETRDPAAYTLDLAALAACPRPVSSPTATRASPASRRSWPSSPPSCRAPRRGGLRGPGTSRTPPIRTTTSRSLPPSPRWPMPSRADVARNSGGIWPAVSFASIAPGVAASRRVAARPAAWPSFPARVP
jgi:pimeloyl-ACP methyl ester carboxylesterase